MSIHKRKLKSKGVSYLAVVSQKGVQRTKTFRKYNDALCWEKKQYAELKVMQISEDRITPASIRLSELFETWIVKHALVYKSPSSIYSDKQMFQNQFNGTLGHLKADEVDSAEIHRWIENQRSVLAAKTINNCIGMMKKVYNDAIRWGLVSKNPFKEVKPLKLTKQPYQCWSREECKNFLKWVFLNCQDEYLLYFLVINTGLRRGEVAALLPEDFDFDRRLLTVQRSYCFRARKVMSRTKSNRCRMIPISKVLFEVVSSYVRYSIHGTPLFDWYDFNHASRTLSMRARLAGVRPIKFHALRHTFATNFLDSGGDIYALRQILGHSSVKQTEQYVHFTSRHLRGATECLSWTVD